MFNWEKHRAEIFAAQNHGNSIPPAILNSRLGDAVYNRKECDINNDIIVI